MDIEEAISKHKISADACRRHDDKRGVFYSYEEHEQIIRWLKELKLFREINNFSVDELYKISSYLKELMKYKKSNSEDGEKYETY